MTFGIIGGGMIADFHAQAILAIEGATLGGIYARRIDQARTLGEKYNCAYFDDLDALLQDPNIDIVTIATPSGAHMNPAISAANAGKHIICEKPLEITPNRIAQMITAAEKNGVILSGIFNRRFNPALQALKKAVDEGRFGQLTLCDAQIKWYRDQAYYDSGAWRGTWELDGGGALMNQAIHTIDQLLYCAGPIQKLSASVATLTHEGIEVEDTAVAILEFKNGARGTIQASTGCWSSTGHPSEIQLCGEYGSAFLRDETFSVWDFKDTQPEDADILKHHMTTGAAGLGANDPSAINFVGHQRNFEDVIDAIKNKRKPKVSGEEAIKAVELICAIYESARNGGNWVELRS